MSDPVFRSRVHIVLFGVEDTAQSAVLLPNLRGSTAELGPHAIHVVVNKL